MGALSAIVAEVSCALVAVIAGSAEAELYHTALPDPTEGLALRRAVRVTVVLVFGVYAAADDAVAVSAVAAVLRAGLIGLPAFTKAVAAGRRTVLRAGLRRLAGLADVVSTSIPGAILRAELRSLGRTADEVSADEAAVPGTDLGRLITATEAVPAGSAAVCRTLLGALSRIAGIIAAGGTVQGAGPEILAPSLLAVVPVTVSVPALTTIHHAEVRFQVLPAGLITHPVTADIGAAVLGTGDPVLFTDLLIAYSIPAGVGAAIRRTGGRILAAELPGAISVPAGAAADTLPQAFLPTDAQTWGRLMPIAAGSSQAELHGVSGAAAMALGQQTCKDFNSVPVGRSDTSIIVRAGPLAVACRPAE